LKESRDHARFRLSVFFAFKMKLALCVCLGFASLAVGQDRGVIHDPDGYVNVRAEPSVDAAIVTTVKNNQPFEFESGKEVTEWFKVNLQSGESGWMHASRIVLYFEEKDLPVKHGPEDELGMYGREHGFVYARLARNAANGDAESLKRYFGITDTDGAAAEEHFSVFTAVFHLVGDTKFAAFLSTQPLAYQLDVRKLFAQHDVTYPFKTAEYLRRHFPKTAKILFRREITDWLSPDGNYAIRKIISDEFDLEASKIERAELIEKKTGKVVADLTRDDRGSGIDREGEVLWAPDSRRFAYFSQTASEGRVVVYQLNETTSAFQRVELPIEEMPGADRDPELKDAQRGHSFAEPTNWSEPNVLLIERHDYFEVKRPPYNSIHGIGRLYHITLAINEDATATVKAITVEK
jgi:Bacterial SH3 domain